MAFDATVLCRALLNPKAVEFELLVHAGQGMPFTGFTTDVVGMEFVRNAYEGFGVGPRFRRYTEEELTEFLDTFSPLFDVDNIEQAPIGRALPANHAVHNQPVGEVLYELTGQADDSLLEALEAQPTLTSGPSVKHFDPFDLHLALTAIERGADVICTNNTTDYSMPNLGPVRISTPLQLAQDYGLV